MIGPAGSGKTRLAIEAAKRSILDHPDGAWFVDLSTITDGDLVPRVVADACGVIGDEAERVPSVLSGRAGLLLLDNCEHVLDAASAFVRRLLAAGEDLRVLATSRQSLDVSDGLVLRVGPLSVPAHGASVTSATTYDAVRLFVARARTIRSEFELTASTAEDVVEICRGLDGLPLALELAAARLRVLTTRQVRGGVDDALRIAAGGRASAPDRHETLRAALDWSYEQLGDAEKLLLSRLSVFVGWFGLSQAEEVAAFGALDRRDVLDAISSLFDRSLIEVDVGPDDDESRFRLLEPIRQYAAEKLAGSADVDTATDRHRRHVFERATALAEGMLGPDGYGAARRLDALFENLRLAVGRALESAPDEAVDVLPTVGLFYLMTGRPREWLSTVAAALDGRPSSDVRRARALAMAAWMAFDIRDASAVDAALESTAIFDSLPREEQDDRYHVIVAVVRAIGAAMLGLPDDSSTEAATAMAGRLDDRFAQIFAQGGRGVAAFFSGRHEEGLAQLDAALEACTKEGRTLLHDLVLMERCLCAMIVEDVDWVRAHLDDAIPRLLEASHRRVAFDALVEIGSAAFHARDVSAARISFVQARGLAMDAGLMTNESYVWLLEYLAWVAELEGDLVRARERLEEALPQVEGRLEARYRADLAEVLILLDDERGARRELVEALRASRRPPALNGRVNEKPAIAQTLDATARVELNAGRFGRAARLFGAAASSANSGDSDDLPWRLEERHRRGVRSAEAALGASRFDAEFSAGASLAPNEAIAYALQEPDDGRVGALLWLERLEAGEALGGDEDANLDARLDHLEAIGAGPLSAALNVLAERASSVRDWDTCERYARRALEICAEIDDGPNGARSLGHLGRVLVERGAIVDAARLAGAARQLGEDRVSAELIASVRDALGSDADAHLEEGKGMTLRRAAAIVVKGKGRRRRPATGWTALTAIERQVVELVAEGLTNVAIGERLFISRRTVQAHLARIFPKLGVSSRAELAARAARADLEASR